MKFTTLLKIIYHSSFCWDQSLHCLLATHQFKGPGQRDSKTGDPHIFLGGSCRECRVVHEVVKRL